MVSVRAQLDASAAGTVELLTAIGSTEHLQQQTLAAGDNHVTWDVTVPAPALWWPHALGDQPLVRRRPSRSPPTDGSGSDRRTVRTGLRQVSMRNWIMSVNGERLFLKGSNQGPTRMDLADATADELAADVAAARDAGLDLLRLHAHVTRPELYEAADRAGLLLWQDLPLQWGYARGIRSRPSARPARPSTCSATTRRSPCGAVTTSRSRSTSSRAPQIDAGRVAARFAVAQQLPSWNKTVLDRSVRRALDKADGSRPVVAHSGVLPHLPKLDGTDSHLYFGWYHGDERDLAGFAQAVPRMVRFVSEFGAQAVPETAEFMEPERWPDLDWDRLGRTHALAEADVRPAGAAGRARQLRRLAHGDPGLPGRA